MNPLVFPLLRCLSDGAFHSAAALAQRLGCSRHQIRRLLDEVPSHFALTLECVPGRGYRMQPTLEWLDAAVIQANLHYPLALEVCESIDSTNTALLQRPFRMSRTPLALFAELQTAGRGRRGRRWLSTLGGALTFSLRWSFSEGISRLSGLSLAVGVAIVRALALFGVDVALKWPNDVLLNGKKLAGVLIEVSGDAPNSTTAVIGVGINLRTLIGVEQAVAALDEIAHPIGRNVLAVALLDALYEVLSAFATDGFRAWRSAWEQCHAYQAQPVLLLPAQGDAIEGVALGVDDEGALRLQTAQGVQLFHVGDVSLRGMP